MNKSVEAMSVFTDILRTQDVERHMDAIKKCCIDMERAELQNIICELITSVCVNCKLSVYEKVFTDAAIELDEKYDEQYQV